MLKSCYQSHGQVCYRCNATKGNQDVAYVYTDLSEGAAWRTDLDIPQLWEKPPAMSNLSEFDSTSIALDLLHIFHLGIARDLVGSGMKLLCRKRNEFYSGANISARLGQLSRELHAWVKACGLQLSLRKIKRENLKWRATCCPEIRCKAADAIICLQFLARKLEGQTMLHYPAIATCLWSAERFLALLSHASTFLLEEEALTAYRLGTLFLQIYVSLAASAVSRNEFYFKCRPKLHYLCHVVDSLRPTTPGCLLRNPFADATFCDEDYIKHMLTCKRRMAHRTSSLNVLRRFLVMNRTHVDRLLQ